ncbi:coiled-coil domain-containing protein 170 isoform X4 [Mesocricetus auratus]|uniref:Coiled-coil domain-containing protein 170 isoform X4 n=1 Tax=Mesocricetus auratus TaxID=10036 RepID=A0ABM2XD99_MESAU|nr:coiled-coil domain-containing protein 170 isoform X4 [Mesocricetus auratus]
MSRPLQSLNHSDPGRLANSQTQEACEVKPSEAGHLSHLSAQENVPVACFDPPLEAVPTRNPIIYNKKTADPVHPDLAGLLVKNKTLLAEVRNLQSKLFIKESSLQEMKTDLESYKESNAQQSLQIMSLRDDVKNLQDLIASLMKIKVLKNTDSQNLRRGSWDLTERVIDLENRLREHLVEREKAERKAELEKRWPCSGRFSPCVNLNEPEDSLDIFPVKKTEALQQEIQMLTKRLDQLYHLYEEAAERSPQTEESYMGQKRPLQNLERQAAVNSFLLDMGRKKESSRTRSGQTDKHRKFKQLNMLLDIEQNSKMTAAPRMEEKIQRLQKQLSDLKLSNKNMKTQLTRINVLKDKTIERLRQSVTKVETVKEKTAAKTDNLKTPSDSAGQAARSEKEGVYQSPARGPPEHPTTKSALKGASGREQELADFRETIMKMLGFNMKTADKEAINQLKLVIQVYEISSRSKASSTVKPDRTSEQVPPLLAVKNLSTAAPTASGI